MAEVSPLLAGADDSVMTRLLAEFNGHITQENIQAKSLDANYVLRNGTISGALIMDDSITAQQLAPDSVGSSEIAADAVGASELTTLVDLTKPVVTSLPGSPTDGEVVYYQNSAMEALGVVWAFKYRAASGSTHKWEFVGGGNLSTHAAVFEQLNTTTYSDLANGPSLTVPLAGDYTVSWGAQLTHTIAAAYILFAGLKLGGAATVDANCVLVAGGNEGGATCGATVHRTKDFTGLTASMVLKLQYKVAWSAGTNVGDFQNRNIAITPIRCS